MSLFSYTVGSEDTLVIRAQPPCCVSFIMRNI